MTLKRARLMLDNHTLTATSVTVSPSPDAGYPASNLQDGQRRKICRVTGATLTAVIRLTTTPWVHALMLTGLGYPVDATVTLKGHTVDGDWSNATVILDNQPAYPSAAAWGGGRWGEYGWGGYIASGLAPYYRAVSAHYFDLQTWEWYRLTITSPTASTIGLGVLGLCSMVEAARNFRQPWTLAPVDPTEMVETSSDDLAPGRRGQSYDTADLDFSNWPSADAWDIHLRLKNIGRRDPVFIALHPESGSVDEACTTLYGRITDYSGLTRLGPNLNKFSIKFREMT